MKGIGKASRLLIVVLALAGWSLISRISFTEQTETPSRVLIVSTTFSGASSLEVEEKITHPLEGRLSLIPEIDNIRSYSSPGRSRIEVSIRPKTDLLVAERKIRMMCRIESRDFPRDAGAVSVAFQGQGASAPAISINISSDLSQDSLFRWLKPRLAMGIGNLQESERIEYPDLCQQMIEIGLNRSRLKTAGISPNEVRMSIETASRELTITSVNDMLPTIRWATIKPSRWYLDSLFVINQNQASFRLSQFIQLREKSDCKMKRWRDGEIMFGVKCYFHPGGWTNRNHDLIYEVFQKLEKETEGAILIEVIEDNLGNSLKSSQRILIQCGLSVAILAVLLFLTSGRWQAFFLLMLLIGSLGLSFLGLYVLDLALSVSVVGGLTLGLGMASDNGIMVLSRHTDGNYRRQILPLIAATLTTLVPLLLVQWVDLPIIKTILGFGMALSMVLSASLVVCWAALPVAEQHALRQISPKYQAVTGSGVISRIRQARRWIYVGLILMMGIPVPEFPERIYVKDKELEELYRNTIGTYEVQQIWQPRILDWIGGLSRPFFSQVQRGEPSSKEDAKEIKLVLKGTADIGTYREQMCDLAARIEQELMRKKIPEIRLERSCGPSAECMITVYASRSRTDLRQVEEVYRWLISKAKKTSGIDWSLSGVGEGWSNEKIQDQPWQLKLQGHQYVKLLRHATQLADSLRSLPGVMEAYVGQSQTVTPFISYRLDLQKLGSCSAASFLQETRIHGEESGQLLRVQEGQKRMVPFLMSWNPRLSLSAFLAGPSVNQPDPSPRSRYLTLDSLLDSPEIYKEDQVYEVQVNWAYVGSVKMGERLKKSIRERLVTEPLPGCKLKPVNSGPVWDLPFLSVLVWLIPVLVIIFVICAVFLESLLYAFLVLLTIPFGWIGAMACIMVTNGSLDSGSVAGFFLVTGLTVNHTIFLLMPLRTMRKLTAGDIVILYRRKMRPILLTMVSTILTFGPFCLMSGQDPFWAHLAYITISGLFSGVILTLICLPAFPGILSHSQ